MTEPALDHIERYAGLYRAHSEGMAESLRAGICAIEVGPLHDLTNPPVARHSRPRPDSLVIADAGNAEEISKRLKQAGRHRNRAIDVSSALFKTFKYNDSCFEIDICGSQRQGFRNPASGYCDEPAKTVHCRLVASRLAQKAASFGLGQIFTLTVEIEHRPGHDWFATLVFIGLLVDQKRPGALGLESD